MLKRMEVKIIPAAISAVLLILFIAPFFKGIACLGNCAGTVISAALLAIFIFWSAFKSLICRMWEHRAGKIIIVIAGAVAAVCVILALAISIFMLKAANSPPKDENVTVVVLGCQVKDGRPSIMLRKRLNAAYDYLSEHENVSVVVSGGKGSDEAISEALCMKNYLTERGISPERIYMEENSTSTYENLKFSHSIIESEGLPQRVCLVTDGYHQLRAQMIADKQGIDTDSISCPTSLWLVPTYWVRELFGVAYYAVFG